MVSDILHRISKKSNPYSFFRQFLSSPAGMIGSMVEQTSFALNPNHQEPMTNNQSY